MKKLSAIWNKRTYKKDADSVRHLAAMFQPESYEEFHAHPDFD